MRITMTMATLLAVCIPMMSAFPTSNTPPVDLTSDGALDGGLQALETFPHSNGGIVTTYSDPIPDLTSATVSSALSCDPKGYCDTSRHLASAYVCQDLHIFLAAKPWVEFAKSPRHICLNHSGSQCCASWSREISGVKWGEIATEFEAVLDDCWKPPSNLVSGKTYNTWLHSGCSDVCLSNRPKGC